MFNLIYPIKNYYDDTVEEQVVEEETPIETPPPVKETKSFSQEEVNKFLAEERRKAQKSNERSIKQLEDLKKTAALTSEEKERLETRIEDLKNEYLTKEEITKKEVKKQADKAKIERDEVIKERDRWKTLFTESTIDRELLEVAGKHKAYNPTQVLNQLKPSTRLVEELDEENKPTGRHIPKVKFVGKDKDGKPVQMDLTVTEAVKQMTEMPDQYGNLFISGSNGGFGLSNVTKHITSNEAPTDPAQYREWRKKNPHQVGIR